MRLADKEARVEEQDGLSIARGGTLQTVGGSSICARVLDRFAIRQQSLLQCVMFCALRLIIDVECLDYVAHGGKTPIQFGTISPQLRRRSHFLPPPLKLCFVASHNSVYDWKPPLNVSSSYQGEMVLERLWRLGNKPKEDSLELDGPDAYRAGEYEDCLSCRVLGTNESF